jgi:formate dehydrogenase iron-sulfur subunit
MSLLLPIVEPKPDYVGELLRQQQSLSAVERFSSLHDAREITVAGEPAQAKYYRDLMPATPPGPGQQFAFEVDLDKCSGCKACVVACHTLNGLDENEAWRSVGTVSGANDSGRLQHVTTACHHCEDPACLNGCPVKAYEKDPVTGIVRHLDDQCIGCKYCVMMCPYEVPQYSDRLGIVRKCDMCHQRLSVGEAPACVQACPNEAISIRIVDTANDSMGQTVVSSTGLGEDGRLAPGAPPSDITRPTTVYKIGRKDFFVAAEPQDFEIDRVADNHWPLAVMLVATQVSVGALVAERGIASLLWLAAGEWPQRATVWAGAIALIIAGMGLNLAPLHLGQPLRAWRVFLGVRTSWLSREAVVLGKYVGLLGIAVAMVGGDHYREHLPDGLAYLIPTWGGRAALGLAIPIGLFGLYSSGMIYIVTRRVLWRGSRTFTKFFGTAFVGGWAVMLPIVMFCSDHPAATSLTSLTIVAAMLMKLVWEWHTQISLSSAADRYDVRARRLIVGPLRGWWTARIGLGVAGIVAVAGAVCANAAAMPWIACATAVCGAAFLIGGEMCERLIYFSAVVYDRMPGILR